MKIVGVRIGDDSPGVRFERAGAVKKDGEWVVKGKPLASLLEEGPIYEGVTIIVELEEHDDLKAA